MATKPLHFEQHGQMCILSVDDDAVNLMVMEQLLATFGWNIISAMDSQEAFAALEADFWPDLVFLDFHMANGDAGDEICRKMRALFGAAPIPIIMCTALSAGSDAIEECLKAGASDYLLKPYEHAKVVAMIKQYVGSKMRSTPTPPQSITVAVPASVPPSVPPPAPSLVLPPVPPDIRSAITQSALAAASSSASNLSVQAFCTSLDLEYCGKKLSEAGVTLEALRGMDDAALRKAGIVVKAQRERLIDGARQLA